MRILYTIFTLFVYGDNKLAKITRNDIEIVKIGIKPKKRIKYKYLKLEPEEKYITEISNELITEISNELIRSIIRTEIPIKVETKRSETK